MRPLPHPYISFETGTQGTSLSVTQNLHLSHHHMKRGENNLAFHPVVSSFHHFLQNTKTKPAMRLLNGSKDNVRVIEAHTRAAKCDHATCQWCILRIWSCYIIHQLTFKEPKVNILNFWATHFQPLRSDFWPFFSFFFCLRSVSLTRL